jgi:hypothetical protein
VALRNFPGATAATAVGNAAAGGIAIGYSETGKVLIGDYDQENDSPENDVAATTRGRGTAEAGLVSLSIAPNDSAEVLGDVRATANQGSAVGGAFSLTNSFETSEQGVDVNARTSEYDAGEQPILFGCWYVYCFDCSRLLWGHGYLQPYFVLSIARQATYCSLAAANCCNTEQQHSSLAPLLAMFQLPAMHTIAG